jgi:DNA invertase Pin-like site-specific DNA recombinase
MQSSTRDGFVGSTGLLENPRKRGIHCTNAESGLDTKVSTGKFILQIIGAIAEFERSVIMEWVRGTSPGRSFAASRRKRRTMARFPQSFREDPKYRPALWQAVA